MMKIIQTMSLALLFSVALSAQNTCDFESFGLSVDSYNNNSTSGSFDCENISLFNDYSEEFMFWSGWALSSITDNTTGGLANQYSSIAGGGHNSDTYALTYAFSGSVIRFDQTSMPESISISNSSYAYFSMLEGDAFAKKFGGETGDDPDYFDLEIRKYLNGDIGTLSIELRLADYTFSDNAQDYILEGWNEIDLSPLGNADSLLFTLSSTDNGDFGMNTPAYFCIDNVSTTPLSISIQELDEGALNIFPNPAQDVLNIELEQVSQVRVYNALQQEVSSVQFNAGRHQLAVNNWPAGIYFLHVQQGEKRGVQRFVIK
ncbi:MAG: DUF4465 domain-containing protein [Bacteroidota bacterium]